MIDTIKNKKREVLEEVHIELDEVTPFDFDSDITMYKGETTQLIFLRYTAEIKNFTGYPDSDAKEIIWLLKEEILNYKHNEPSMRFFNYPYQAIEEALVNAVYHRGYDVREPVEVRIMEDRIHIVSYPGPDRSISEKSIEDKNMIARKYRNRRIGEFLKELKLTEGRNTGIPKIKRALKNNGSKEPEFETNETRDYFITTIFMHDGFENKNLNKNEVINEVINEAINFTENEAKVMSLIRENKNITKKEIVKKTKLSKSTVDRIITNLKEKNIIRRNGANKNGYWESLK